MAKRKFSKSNRKPPGTLPTTHQSMRKRNIEELVRDFRKKLGENMSSKKRVLLWTGLLVTFATVSIKSPGALKYFPTQLRYLLQSIWDSFNYALKNRKEFPKEQVEIAKSFHALIAPPPLTTAPLPPTTAPPSLTTVVKPRLRGSIPGMGRVTPPVSKFIMDSFGKVVSDNTTTSLVTTAILLVTNLALYRKVTSVGNVIGRLVPMLMEIRNQQGQVANDVVEHIIPIINDNKEVILDNIHGVGKHIIANSATDYHSLLEHLLPVVAPIVETLPGMAKDISTLIGRPEGSIFIDMQYAV